MPSLPGFALKIADRDAAASLTARIADVEVEARRGLPASFTLRAEFETDAELLETIDAIVGKTLAVGTSVELMRATARTRTTVLSGVVESIGVDLASGRTAQRPAIVIRGHDRGHRLTLEQTSRTFEEMRLSDVAAQIAAEHGLSSSTDSSPIVTHLIQASETDWAFLRRLADRIGFEVFVDDDRLHFRRAGTRGRTKLTWGRGLTRFAPSLTGSHQTVEVTVRGWDPDGKETVTGVGSVGDPRAEGRVVHVADRAVRTTEDAMLLAQSIADDIVRSARTATGTLEPGNPNLMPGTTVTVAGVGTTLGGAYAVEEVSHRFTADGYSTSVVLGGRPGIPSGSASATVAGDGETTTAIGLVVDNQDPSNLGRVRVAFPWLGDDVVSSWARLATPMAGSDRGVFLLPGVGEEVLVGFEQGALEAPHVLGGLWSDVDRPPVDAAGGSDVRLIRSREGHEIRLDDSSGAGGVEIETSGGHTVRLDDDTNRIEVVAGEDGPSVQLDAATGAITLTSATTVTIDAGTDVIIKAGNSLVLEANNELRADASRVTVEGSAMTTLQAGGAMTIKGALVTIN